MDSLDSSLIRYSADVQHERTGRRNILSITTFCLQSGEEALLRYTEGLQFIVYIIIIVYE